MQSIQEFSSGTLAPRHNESVSGSGSSGSKLVLATVAEVQISPLLAFLQKTGFIGTPIHSQSVNKDFLVGGGFFELITFMGCSPYLALEPTADGGPFCYIRLEGPWPLPKFCYGVNTQWPRCVYCRRRIVHWRELVPTWIEQPQAASVLCPHCGQHQRPLDLGWRHTAGFGNIFITTENVFPGEAVPVPDFLTGLGRLTATNWDYFYLTVA